MMLPNLQVFHAPQSLVLLQMVHPFRLNAKQSRKAASELGYSPNFLARSLTTRTKLIGLVSDNFHNPLFLEVFDQFTRGLQDRGLRPLLVNLSVEPDAESSARMLQQYSVDGVIVASSTLPPAFSKTFRDAGVPVVNSFGRYSSDPDMHIVGIDNIECIRMAAHELLKRGYKKIGFSVDLNLQPQPKTGLLDLKTNCKNIQTLNSATAFPKAILSMPDALKCSVYCGTISC